MLTPPLKHKVLFLCTGNSCRSQMAEGLARQLGSEVIEPYSAGTHPVGINPKAIVVMEEIGIDMSGHSSKPIESIGLDQLDLVVTLCGDAAEHCPVLPSHLSSVHWGLEDPARSTGSEQVILAKFRETRDLIRSLVEQLIDDLKSTKPPAHAQPHHFPS